MNAFDVRDYLKEHGTGNFIDDNGSPITVNFIEGIVLYGCATIHFDFLSVNDWDELQLDAECDEDYDPIVAYLECKSWRVIE